MVPSDIIKSLNAPVGVDQVLSPLKNVVAEAVPVADKSPVMVPVAVIVPPVMSTNVPELVATEVTVPTLLVHPSSLSNTLRGMLLITMSFTVLESAESLKAIESAPINVVSVVATKI